jgi:hypothetical protein
MTNAPRIPAPAGGAGKGNCKKTTGQLKAAGATAVTLLCFIPILLFFLFSGSLVLSIMPQVKFPPLGF